MIYYTTVLFLCQDFLFFFRPRNKWRFLYILHYVRQASTTKLWKGVILTNPFGCARINSTGHPESENERNKQKTPRLLLCRTASARYTCLAFLATRDIASPKTVLNRFCLALHAKMRKNERHTHHITQLYAGENGAQRSCP